jgi:hypothetical protein
MSIADTSGPLSAPFPLLVFRVYYLKGLECLSFVYVPVARLPHLFLFLSISMFATLETWVSIGVAHC